MCVILCAIRCRCWGRVGGDFLRTKNKRNTTSFSNCISLAFHRIALKLGKMEFQLYCFVFSLYMAK